LSYGRSPFAHDHHSRHLVLGVEDEAVIQIGEDAFEPLLERQVGEGHGNFFLEKGFVAPEPDTRLLFDVSCYFQKRCLFDVHGKRPLLETHRLSAHTVLTKEEAENTSSN
jgi:hypothetical protein